MKTREETSITKYLKNKKESWQSTLLTVVKLAFLLLVIVSALSLIGAAITGSVNLSNW